MSDSESNAPAMETDGSVAYATMKGRLRPELLKAVEQMGFTTMTPVQEETLNLPNFTDDCLVRAKTGTGKTLGFLLPVLDSLLAENKYWQRTRGVYALVLAPTRELAIQIVEECDKLTSQCNPPVECHMAVGGSARPSHLKKFLGGKPAILVATPGRLNDILTEDEVRDKFKNLRCVILDEADRMLDQGFLPDLTKILSQLPSKANAKWQGMCFSATMPPQINSVLPLVLGPGHHRISTVKENEVPTVMSIPQSVIPVESANDILPTLHNLLSCEKMDNPSLKALIFTSTAKQAALMYHLFGYTGGASPGKLPVYQMHSRMSQPQRNRTVQEFKEATSGLLFASDVVGRGMDFPDITLVVQVGLTTSTDQYVHRVGRTGRAGKSGRATMIMLPEDMPFIEKNLKLPIERTQITHPKASTIQSADIIQKALEKLPEETKVQAYVAYLGFTKAMMKVHGISKKGVVWLGERYSESLGLEEPPALQQNLIGKLGLVGCGIRVAQGRPVRTGRQGKKQTLDGNSDATPSAPTSSASNNQNANPSKGPRRSSGEPRRKKPRRDPRGQASA